MKIYSIRIKGFQQFHDTSIDFKDPDSGKPANKVCIIGRNGTGKSTLLNVLTSILNNFGAIVNIGGFRGFYITLIFDFKDQKYCYFLSHDRIALFKQNIEIEHPDWFENLSVPNIDDFTKIYEYYSPYAVDDISELCNKIRLEANSTDLLIHSPAEGVENVHLSLTDVPQTSLNEALGFFDLFPYYHYITNDTVAEFWKLLIYLIKKRENERERFENDPENLNKTKSQLINEFEKINPKILNKIAELWNNILDKTGLEFDVEKAQNPIQLNENLKAYIILKKTKERIGYNNLSTGIRNFIFRIGHIHALYFNKEIKRGFMLIDEPENSLFPDFLFDLVSIYEQIAIDKNGENNTQLFMSTHNPIIAAQFEPYERVILDWDEDGYVQAYKGVAPVGDDPNDILLKDFKLTHVMGKKGQEFWIRYLDLKKKLRNTTDDNEKKLLVKKINEISIKYNFDYNEVSKQKS